MALIVNFPASRMNKSRGGDGLKTKARVHFSNNIEESCSDDIILTDEVRNDMWYTSSEMKSFQAQMIIDAEKIAQLSSFINSVDEVALTESAVCTYFVGLEKFLNLSTFRKQRVNNMRFLDIFFLEQERQRRSGVWDPDKLA